MTTARPPHSVELSQRFRRYVFSMTVRTVALVLAIFVVHGWLRLVAIVAGIALPWLAVVIANAGLTRKEQGPMLLRHDELERETATRRDEDDDGRRSDSE